MRYMTLLMCLLLCACSASAPSSPVSDDAGPDAAPCYPAEPGVRLMCETVCGINERDYQRSGGADAGIYFDYAACLDECGCDEWPDAGQPVS